MCQREAVQLAEVAKTGGQAAEAVVVRVKNAQVLQVAEAFRQGG